MIILCISWVIFPASVSSYLVQHSRRNRCLELLDTAFITDRHTLNCSLSLYTVDHIMPELTAPIQIERTRLSPSQNHTPRNSYDRPVQYGARSGVSIALELTWRYSARTPCEPSHGCGTTGKMMLYSTTQRLLSRESLVYYYLEACAVFALSQPCLRLACTAAFGDFR